MRMHPAGKDLEPSQLDTSLPTVHRVAPGESLWTIAEHALGTKDPLRLARYWHKIHRTNREVIGRDPDRIFPGQQLTLPAESR
ncbi:MAG: LysM peptidoglycan-binding domain-containing protein [Actinomycetota bacterium]